MGSKRSTQRFLVPGLAVALGLALSVLPAGASTMRFLEVEDLARSSTLVARARILSARARWTEGQKGIVTEVRAVVLGALASSGVPPREGRQITILQAGGEVDGVRLDWIGRPTFEPGEDLILFLQPHDPADPADERMIVVGGKQGKMRVLPQAGAGAGALVVERNLAGILDAPAFEGVEPTGPGHRRDQIPFDELSRRVRPAGGGR